MKNKKFRLILTAFVISFLLMIVKFIAYYFSNSNAILTDALESIVNVIASGFGMYSVYISSQPRDSNHPYGHGKIEFFSVGIEGILIALASIYILFHTVFQLLNPSPLKSLDIGIYLMILASIINYIMGYFLLKEGIKSNSVTLEADGKHLIFDAQFGFLIVVGISIVYFTNLKWIDSVLAIGFAVYIFISGIKMIKSSVSALMDEADPLVFEKVVAILVKNRSENWIDVHNLRLQKYGANLHIDCHLTLPNYLTLKQSHDLVHDFENCIKEEFNNEVEIFVHADPCLEDCCSHCNLSDCQVRRFTKSKEIEWNSLNLALNQKHYLEV